jgi:prophage regulatory protein
MSSDASAASSTLQSGGPPIGASAGGSGAGDDDPHLLSRADLKRLGIRISNSSLLHWERCGRFPQRIYMGGTRVAWIRAEVKPLPAQASGTGHLSHTYFHSSRRPSDADARYYHGGNAVQH